MKAQCKTHINGLSNANVSATPRQLPENQERMAAERCRRVVAVATAIVFKRFVVVLLTMIRVYHIGWQYTVRRLSRASGHVMLHDCGMSSSISRFQEADKPMLRILPITGIPGLAEDFLATYSIILLRIAYEDRE
jgi:hypothetical protein